MREERKLKVACRAKELWDRGHPESPTEQFVAHALAESPETRTAVLWYIVRRLSQPYIWEEWHAGRLRRHVLMIDENRKYQRAGVSRAREFLLQLDPQLSGILTTNYDLRVEYALGSKGFNYGRAGEELKGRGPYPVSQWLNPVVLRGAVSLAKMHGSISWDLEGRYTDGRRGLSGNALIVAPAPEKTPPASLALDWELAGRILRNSTHLLVFGFAFNPYDEALLTHLKEYGCDIERVTVIDKNPNPGRVQRVWPGADIEALLPPCGDERLSGWFSRIRSMGKTI